ncbi:hypothetical protein [Thiocystis violacea]|nr:hypothetical protein [Thiocystis violacea]
MSAMTSTTTTKTRVLTDEVRESPVDIHLQRVHRRILWVILFLVAIIIIL